MGQGERNRQRERDYGSPTSSLPIRHSETGLHRLHIQKKQNKKMHRMLLDFSVIIPEQSLYTAVASKSILALKYCDTKILRNSVT